MKMTSELLLQQHQLQKTLSRKKILDIFLKTKKPLTLKQIQLKMKDTACDQATIYRILKIFQEKKLIESFQLNQKAAYFELLRSHHHHIMCKKCHKIDHLEECFSSQIEKSLLKKGYTELEHKIEFFGLCQNCV